MTGTKRVTWVWLLLTALTIGSWWLAPAQYSETLRPSVPITALVLAMAVIKSRMIIREFMEVRTAPRWLELATDGWLVVLFGLVFGIYLI